MINYHRQLDIYNPAESEAPDIHIIGCGGIGSFLAFYLGQLGLAQNLILWDNDVVEDHNIPNQNFLLEHVGKSKCIALADYIEAKTGERPRTKERFFTKESHITSGIVCLCTDNIDSRKLVYADVRDKADVIAIVDGRIGGEMFCIYTARLSDAVSKQRYEETFFDAKEAAELPCTAKAIIYVGAHIGALMCKQVKNIVKHEPCHSAIEIDHKSGVTKYEDSIIVPGTGRIINA